MCLLHKHIKLRITIDWLGKCIYWFYSDNFWSNPYEQWYVSQIVSMSCTEDPYIMFFKPLNKPNVSLSLMWHHDTIHKSTNLYTAGLQFMNRIRISRLVVIVITPASNPDVAKYNVFSNKFNNRSPCNRLQNVPIRSWLQKRASH